MTRVRPPLSYRRGLIERNRDHDARNPGVVGRPVMFRRLVDALPPLAELSRNIRGTFFSRGGRDVLLKSAYRPLQSLNAATTSVTGVAHYTNRAQSFPKTDIDLCLALLRKLGAQNLDSCNRKTIIAARPPIRPRAEML